MPPPVSREFAARRAKVFFATLAIALVTIILVPKSSHHRGLPRFVNLQIPDQGWDPQRPDTSVGWCAEASIQMAVRFYGDTVSQIDINRAGKPDHHDPYEYNIDPALHALGVSSDKWQGSDGDVQHFIDWIRREVAARHPVLCGFKAHPDGNPNWDFDHFMLVVGYTPRGLVVNTTTNGQRFITYRQLRSRHRGYSFRNSSNFYLGRAITGVLGAAAP
jgi:hypothetical protein